MLRGRQAASAAPSASGPLPPSPSERSEARLGEGLASRLADFSASNPGVQQRASSGGMILYRTLTPDASGTIATTDIAAGGLRETAERARYLQHIGFNRLCLVLLDAGYREAQLGRYVYAAEASEPRTAPHPSAAAAEQRMTQSASDPGGRHLERFLGQLQAWSASTPVTCTVYVARAVADVVRLTQSGELPRSHVVTGYGTEADGPAREIARTGHGKGFFSVHSEWMSQDDLNERAGRRRRLFS